MREAIVRRAHRRAIALPDGVKAAVTRVVPERTRRRAIRALYDAAVVSYPKSGRTWLRTMITTACAVDHGVEVTDPTAVERLWLTDERLPRVMFDHDGDPHEHPPAAIGRDKREFAGQPVVLLARDPRDTSVSLWHHLRGREGAEVGGLDDFVLGEIGGVRSVIAYLNGWADPQPHPARLERVRYEDLRSDPGHHLGQVMEILGFPAPSPIAVATAVEANTFSRMKRREVEGDLRSVRFGGSEGDPASRKVREGKVGGFRNELRPDTQERLGVLMHTLDPSYGYRPEP